MRLEAVDAHRRLERVEALRHGGAVRRNLELAALHQQRIQLQVLLVLALVILGIEPDAHLDHVVFDLFAGRIVVDVPPHERVGRQRAAAVNGNDLADLAQRVLGDALGLDVTAGLLVELDELGVGVMRRGASLRGRLDRDGLDAAVLGHAGLHDRPPPHVLPARGQRVRLGLDDHIGRTELFLEAPLVGIGERLRRRHVGRVALRRAAIDPANDGLDFLLAQAQVVLQLLDADVAIVAIGRHLARHHLLLDRTRPRARLLIGHQRHRSDRIGLMALLTVLLEDRRNVFGKRDRGRGGGLLSGGLGREEDRAAENEKRCPKETGMHL